MNVGDFILLIPKVLLSIWLSVVIVGCVSSVSSGWSKLSKYYRGKGDLIGCVYKNQNAFFIEASFYLTIIGI